MKNSDYVSTHFSIVSTSLGQLEAHIIAFSFIFSLSKQLNLTIFSFSFTENNQKHSLLITAFSPLTLNPPILLHKTWSLTQSAVISWTMRFKDTTLASSLMVKQVISFNALNVPRFTKPPWMLIVMFYIFIESNFVCLELKSARIFRIVFTILKRDKSYHRLLKANLHVSTSPGRDLNFLFPFLVNQLISLHIFTFFGTRHHVLFIYRN